VLSIRIHLRPVRCAKVALVTVALYGTIWAALLLFVAAEAGRRRPSSAGGQASWAYPALVLGAGLMTCHVLVALASRYAWNHEEAVRQTARQAAVVYGFEWRGNIYVSYAFVLLWIVEVWRRKGKQQSDAVRPGAMTWAWRAFFFVIIFNGAVVFATTPWTRALGLALVSALVWAWRPHRLRAGRRPMKPVYTR
jgi:hypothetical protein